jgi:hypothetical protein
MKHQMRGATQTQQGMTLQILTLLLCERDSLNLTTCYRSSIQSCEQQSCFCDNPHKNFINKHIADPENVQRKKKNDKINLQDLKLTQTRCENLFVSTTNQL